MLHIVEIEATAPGVPKQRYLMRGDGEEIRNGIEDIVTAQIIPVYSHEDGDGKGFIAFGDVCRVRVQKERGNARNLDYLFTPPEFNDYANDSCAAAETANQCEAA